MNECKFVLLDLFWDKDLNNGTIKDISPIYDGKKYWWKCYNCGESYLSTVKRVLLDFKMNKKPQLNNYCSKRSQKGYAPRFDYADVLKYIPLDRKEFISELAGDFLDRGNCTYTFYTFCPDCGEFHSASQGTFRTRNGFYCKNCASVRKALITHGSIASELPEVLPYYSNKNKLPADKVPVWKINVDGNNIIVNCPSCGKEISKRMDALINNGAYCGPCAKQKNAYKNGNSLYENYPDVALMFDRGGNEISSKELSHGTNRVYRFLCENGGIPHIIERKVSDMVAASKRGNLGCPVCQGYEIQKGVNDFETRFPEMAKYWDYSKNIDKPSEVYYKSQKKYYFVCSEGHNFKRDISHMRRSVDTKTQGCPICHGKQVVEGVNDLYSLRPDLIEEWDYEINDIKPWEVTVASNRLVNVHCKNPDCDNIYTTSIYSWVNSLVNCCEDCRKRQWSFAEKELVAEIRSWGIEVIEESKFLGGNFSFDIYIPSKSVAIEYNGLYWHSDSVREDTNYHYNKYILCKEAGVQLIYVWEDDYKLNKDIVLKMLKNKLGVSDERKVNARDCKIYTVKYSEAKEFLDNNHIQGGVTGSEYLSLVDSDNNIVALMVLQEDGDLLNLKRYASSCNVRGGFSKLLHMVEDVYNYRGIYTFSDNGVSDGSLYKSNGFSVDKVIKPDYSYVVDGVRKHKFNYRLERFRKDPDLYYEEGLTEKELALANRLVRVWDAGKLRWLKLFK